MAPFSSCFPSYHPPPLSLFHHKHTHPDLAQQPAPTRCLSILKPSTHSPTVEHLRIIFLEVNRNRTPTQGGKCLNKCFVKRSQWKHSVKCQLSDWVIFLFNASVLLRGTWWLCHYATIQQIIIPFFFFLANFTGVWRPFLMNKIALSLYFSKFLCIFKKYLSWSIFILMLNI